jgi:hypothetical protein
VCSEASARPLHHLLSLVLSSGAVAHVKALIMSHVVVSAGSEATAQMLNFLLSLVLSSGAVAHVKALIISHVAVSERHVRAARLPLGCFIICCHSCSAVARLLTSRRSSYHTWPSVGVCAARMARRATAALVNQSRDRALHYAGIARAPTSAMSAAVARVKAVLVNLWCHDALY